MIVGGGGREVAGGQQVAQHRGDARARARVGHGERLLDADVVEDVLQRRLQRPVLGTARVGGEVGVAHVPRLVGEIPPGDRAQFGIAVGQVRQDDDTAVGLGAVGAADAHRDPELAAEGRGHDGQRASQCLSHGVLLDEPEKRGAHAARAERPAPRGRLKVTDRGCGPCCVKSRSPGSRRGGPRVAAHRRQAPG
jgi:hypothetical protein